jgi:hypothetical protein
MLRQLAAAAIIAICSAAIAQQPDESKLVEHGHYKNKAGQDVHSPAHSTDGKVPAGATSRCRDGSYGFSKTHRGACSRHGGVAQWLG